MEDLKDRVGSSIKVIRTRKGLGQAELGARVSKIVGRKISEAQIGHWESGRNLPRLDVIDALATVFDTSIDALVRGEKGFVDELADQGRRLRALEEAEMQRRGDKP